MLLLIIGNNNGPIKDSLYQVHEIRGLLFHIKILPPLDGFVKELYDRENLRARV